MRVGIVGAGKLGKAIIRNVAGRVEVIAVKRKIENIEGAEVTDRIEDLESCDVIIVTLKPNVFRQMLSLIGKVSKEKPVVSFAAGVKLDEMRKFIKRPFRAMTNLAIENKGIITCYPPETKDHLSFMNAEIVPCESENELELTTALIGSSPAIIAYLIHAFILAGIKGGLDYSKARYYATVAFRSAADLYAAYSLDEIVEKIATPAGTTIEGITEILKAQNAVIDSLIATAAKAFKI